MSISKDILTRGVHHCQEKSRQENGNTFVITCRKVKEFDDDWHKLVPLENNIIFLKHGHVAPDNRSKGGWAIFERSQIMSDNYQASCACGKVHFVLDGEPHKTFNCHCAVCRKMNGSAFSTYSVFASDDLRITEGQEEIQTIQMGDHGAKHFCRHCGAPLYGLHKQSPSICLVVLGAIDTGGAILPISNVFCRSKLLWTFEIGKMINHEVNM